MTPTPAAVAAVYLGIARHLTTGLSHATIYPDGIRIDVTDPDDRDRIVAAYGLTRDHSLSGHYSGPVDGVSVAVTLTLPAGIIPARGAA